MSLLLLIMLLSYLSWPFLAVQWDNYVRQEKYEDCERTHPAWDCESMLYDIK